MKITRERKIVALVLGVALVGLGYDRLFNAPAQADAVEPQGVLLASTATPGKSAAKSATSDSSLAGRLSNSAKRVEVTAPQNLRDAFHSNQPWLANTAMTIAAAIAPAPQVAEHFAQTHKLIAVSSSNSGGVAIVDGTLLHIGAAIDGMTLTHVDPRGATFSDASATVRLLLNESSTASSR